MKITKMKRGYIIRLSDTEFDVLQQTVSEGMGSDMWLDDCNGHMSPAEQRVITQVNYGQRDWMKITENRRD